METFFSVNEVEKLKKEKNADFAKFNAKFSVQYSHLSTVYIVYAELKLNKNRPPLKKGTPKIQSFLYKFQEISKAVTGHFGSFRLTAAWKNMFFDNIIFKAKNLI